MLSASNPLTVSIPLPERSETAVSGVKSPLTTVKSRCAGGEKDQILPSAEVTCLLQAFQTKRRRRIASAAKVIVANKITEGSGTGAKYSEVSFMSPPTGTVNVKSARTT